MLKYDFSSFCESCSWTVNDFYVPMLTGCIMGTPVAGGQHPQMSNSLTLVLFIRVIPSLIRMLMAVMCSWNLIIRQIWLLFTPKTSTFAPKWTSLFVVCFTLGYTLTTASNRQLTMHCPKRQRPQVTWLFPNRHISFIKILLYCIVSCSFVLPLLAAALLNFLCLRHPTMSAKSLCFYTVPFVHPVIHSSVQSYFYHNISWMAWTILTKLTGNIRKPLLITWLDSGDQDRSRLSRSNLVNTILSWTTWAILIKLTGNNH